jgi:hypothetical protein
LPECAYGRASADKVEVASRQFNSIQSNSRAVPEDFSQVRYLPMTNVETLTTKLRLLPDDKQAEVADFVDFLLARLSREVQEDDFDQALKATAGIWPDQPDGLAYEDQMRQQWQTRS